MTTIVALQGADFAVVAFDSMVSEGDEKVFYLPRDLPKVVRVGDCIFGAAGDLRAVNLLSTFDLPSPDPKLRGKNLDLWVGKTFVPSLQELFDDAGYDKDNEQASTILLVANCTIYEIGTAYEWLRDECGFYTSGSGAPYAAGFLLSLGDTFRKSLDVARDSAVRAVEIASILDPMTGGRIDTEDVSLILDNG